jgi:hypothetical protein
VADSALIRCKECGRICFDIEGCGGACYLCFAVADPAAADRLFQEAAASMDVLAVDGRDKHGV